jgi:hypothetical protein
MDGKVISYRPHRGPEESDPSDCNISKVHTFLFFTWVNKRRTLVLHCHQTFTSRTRPASEPTPEANAGIQGIGGSLAASSFEIRD